ncbi:uncharacterized protein LOC131308672 isoform X1 [Rhododendron vialii]|uniref:uncharacterized protein LOC131308672 isoform X1 n=1 Tax=Rhododendron vialii TaxID=182163 RepID=UPI00265FB915|nr:uncharacterized protein LOC131308672 isoform X1 [Rhododendron vialii]
MDRSEPTLVPEWLRTTGSVGGGSNSAHHFASSSSQSGNGLSSAPSTRNRCSRSASDKDNSRRSSNGNGSSKHPYSSFSQSQRDRNRDKEKERSAIGNLWDRNDPLGDILISRVEKDTLRRSNSLVYRKPVELLPRRAVDSKNGGSSNHSSTNGVLPGSKLVRSTLKSSFDKDFPSLGTGEKQGVPDIGRVPSPGSTTAVQCLPFVNPGLIGGEGWTSALAEVPNMIGSNSTGPTSVQQSVSSSQSSGASNPIASLNMAEALSQAPSRAHTTPQLPDKTQRLEELAIKQSKQLIPVTPLTPKGLVLSSDKSKPKTAVRTNETMVGSKSVQQQQPQSSQLANHSLHGGQGRSDASRSSHAGKFLVLKPVRENGVSSIGKDVTNPIDNVSRVVNGQVASASAPMLSSAPMKSPKSSNFSNMEGKVAVLSLNSGSTLEKKSSQARSRSDFFNLMRKKTSSNTSADVSLPVEKCCELVEGASSRISSCASETGSEVTNNGDSSEGEKNLCLNGTLYPDEEEAAFLRSLGWEENAGEEDGLTEEEINAFYDEYMKLRPSLKLSRGVQPKLSMLPESPISGSSRASSETEA